ncbi:MAG TPA: SDR family NAD(P)-dependent oxidoreductase [Acidimicrobiales bacterium]|jgi:NAD(P)-dependent dehydrogenase (short-subunit alcohol dehydrogenase family)|nr:SDR family NAD(P)-dependent oxidoreductase [Acidimicrobiales bacterium]
MPEGTDQLRFDGRVAIVTGAGGGLGRAHAHLLAARGARVVVNDLGGPRDGSGTDPEYAEAVAAEIRAVGGNAVANADSVATTTGAAALVRQAIETWGQVDIVVNNAGITGKGTFAPVEVYERVIATHLLGTVNVLREVWPHFVERDYGRVVNTASSSFLGTPGSGDYASAKGGIVGFSRVLATDNRDRNIAINVLMPVAYTRMTAAVPDPVYAAWLERWFEPEKVAAFVAVLCHESAPCSGETFIAGGGRASRVLFATTRGHFEPDPTPESFRLHFDAVMAGEDQQTPTSGQGDLIRYASLLGDAGPFAPR